MRRILFVCVLSISAIGQSVPFKLQSGYLIVAKCSIGYLHDLTAVVDTGVTETAVDLNVIKKLDLPTRPDAATFGTRDTKIHSVSIPEIDFGPVHVENLGGIAVNLSALTHELGVRADVLIGMDLLVRTNFIIDFKAKQLSFGELPSMAHSVPLLPGSRFALISANADGKLLRFQIDTGFNTILVYGNRLHLLPSEALDAHSGAFGRNIASRQGTVGELQIGDWKGRQITVFVTDDEPRDANFDGLLGPAAISARSIGFDFTHKMM